MWTARSTGTERRAEGQGEFKVFYTASMSKRLGEGERNSLCVGEKGDKTERRGRNVR